MDRQKQIDGLSLETFSRHSSLHPRLLHGVFQFSHMSIDIFVASVRVPSGSTTPYSVQYGTLLHALGTDWAVPR